MPKQKEPLPVVFPPEYHGEVRAMQHTADKYIRFWCNELIKLHQTDNYPGITPRQAMLIALQKAARQLDADAQAELNIDDQLKKLLP